MGGKAGPDRVGLIFRLGRGDGFAAVEVGSRASRAFPGSGGNGMMGETADKDDEPAPQPSLSPSQSPEGVTGSEPMQKATVR
ncbi:hypothetical protein XA68_14299 [Ophiocordyceps unilateralis]|uniref:Uncharacterized protein n=1 Tax=Ophiocordyceps unilateralis TaxID=268505 RepID=A0A2A9P9X2_OPHUN|nr:hypothetical protein XA68_14299 [Ophiocordyceps unilateralis]